VPHPFAFLAKEPALSGAEGVGVSEDRDNRGQKGFESRRLNLFHNPQQQESNSLWRTTFTENTGGAYWHRARPLLTRAGRRSGCSPSPRADP